ncbi:MAG: hypothetical protein ACTSVI_17420 [Promethearchaeota archaeon]
MGEKGLENLLNRLSKEDDDDRILILQGIAEKILSFLLTTIQSTETRLTDLKAGINNISQYISTQFKSLVGRLRTVPGLDDLKEPENLPLLSLSPGDYNANTLDAFKSFIKGMMEEFYHSGKKEAIEGAIKEGEKKVPFASHEDQENIKDKIQKLEERENQLLERETFLIRLADELSEKEMRLQEREKTISIIENGLAEKLKVPVFSKKAGVSNEGTKKDESLDDLEEIKQISESILQGDNIDDLDDDLNEDEIVKRIMENIED